MQAFGARMGHQSFSMHWRMTLVTAGGMLLGWIAGTMIQTDPGLVAYLPQDKAWGYGLGIAGALLVLAMGKIIMARRPARSQDTAS